jgi:hypothetical protein
MSDLRTVREREVLAALAVAVRPTSVLAVNLSNFKAFNTVAGYKAGDELIAGIERGMALLGPAWRTGGNEFIGLLPVGLAAARERVRGFTWLFHIKIGVTMAWQFRFDDGRAPALVPSQHVELVCNPRCGLVAVGPSPEAALDAARQACEHAATHPEEHLRQGFAPIHRPAFGERRKLAEPGCPACGHAAPEIIEADLGWSRERCPACQVGYEREDRQFVLGRDESAGHA